MPKEISIFWTLFFLIYLAFCSIFIFFFAKKQERNEEKEHYIMLDKRKRVNSAIKTAKFKFLK